MKASSDVFEKCCREEFRFLEEIGYAFVDCEKDNYGCRITYKSDKAAVRVELERDGMVINCYKLKDGEIPRYPIFFDPRQEFLIFDVGDLLILRTGRTVEQDPRLMYNGEYMQAKIKEYAKALSDHGTDILSGDFTVLPRIKERVTRRAKELEEEQ